jgi:hypothetical protein
MGANSSSAKRQTAEGVTIAQPRASLHVLDSPQEERSRRKFLRFFPGAFRDETYREWERNYKWNAHLQWNELLGFTEYRALLATGKFSQIASRALRIESRTNLLFSFEKMAIRDAVKSPAGAKAFSTGLYEFLHGAGTLESRFEYWNNVVATLLRKQTRVRTWPVLTVFAFIAQPETRIFLNPKSHAARARHTVLIFNIIRPFHGVHMQAFLNLRSWLNASCAISGRET